MRGLLLTLALAAAAAGAHAERFALAKTALELHDDAGRTLAQLKAAGLPAGAGGPPVPGGDRGVLRRAPRPGVRPAQLIPSGPPGQVVRS